MPSEPAPIPNTPLLWKSCFPWPKADGNKYDRGHVLVRGGDWTMTGATKLAATAALRIGAGLVSVACTRRSLPIYAASFTAVMTKLAPSPVMVTRLLEDPRITATLIGPGAGMGRHTRICVQAILAARKPAVLDADALTVFAAAPAQLFKAIVAPCILTPHEGEFARLFGAVTHRTQDALRAAQASRAVVVLKGQHTVIAAPDGRVSVNEESTPFLATAGTGDVLAGMCVGLLAQGMPAFEAACAAVWLHAQTARRLGAGLVAEDITPALPAVLQELIP